MHLLTTDGLILEPLTAGHAAAMYDVLRDPCLYRFLDESPPASAGALRARYARLESRRSPDGADHWLNWALCPQGRGPIGFVQATVTPAGDAWVAYVLSHAQWGRGHATRAMVLVMAHLRSAYAVQRFLATVDADNHRSIAVLERLGFRPATAADDQTASLTASERLFVAHGPCAGTAAM